MSEQAEKAKQAARAMSDWLKSAKHDADIGNGLYRITMHEAEYDGLAEIFDAIAEGRLVSPQEDEIVRLKEELTTTKEWAEDLSAQVHELRGIKPFPANLLHDRHKDDALPGVDTEVKIGKTFPPAYIP